MLLEFGIWKNNDACKSFAIKFDDSTNIVDNMVAQLCVFIRMTSKTCAQRKSYTQCCHQKDIPVGIIF